MKEVQNETAEASEYAVQSARSSMRKAGLIVSTTIGFWVALLGLDLVFIPKSVDFFPSIVQIFILAAYSGLTCSRILVFIEKRDEFKQRLADRH